MVPTGREIWRERAAISIKEITSSHSHLSCCIHTTNGGSVDIVDRQIYVRSIWLCNITGVHVSTDLYFERNSYWPFHYSTHIIPGEEGSLCSVPVVY